MRPSWARCLRRRPWQRVATAIITVGVLMLLQPLAMVLFRYSFVTTLLGTVLFTVSAKLPE